MCRYEYLWEDGVKYKRPTKLPAPEYVDALMNWAQGLLDNEEIFPNKIGECWIMFTNGYNLTRNQGFPFPRTLETLSARCSVDSFVSTRICTATTLIIYAR